MSIELYDDAFFKKRTTYRKRAPLMIKGIIELCHPLSFVDCGAALGDLVQEAINQNIDGWGIEGNPACFPYIQCPKDKMMILNLAEPIQLDRKFDVLTTLEVAEHIEEQFVDTFIQNICKLSDVLVISICDYGPTTKIHPTVKSHSWWIPKFNTLGFERHPEDEVLLKQKWDAIKTWPAVKEAYRNLIVLKRHA